MPDHDAIPEPLRSRPQWVVWRYEQGTKVPYCPRTKRKASSTNRATWTSFDEARRAVDVQQGYSGVGFVFTADDPYVGIDLDDCRDPETGELEHWAAAIVEHFDSYTEVSPSGRGVKIWVEGELPSNLGPDKQRRDKLELYDRARYFAVTGQVLDGFTEIKNVNGAVTRLHQEVSAMREQRPPPEPTPKAAPAEPSAAKKRETAYLARALDGILSDIQAAQEGSRNTTFNDLCYRLGKFVGKGLISRSDAESVLRPAGIATGMTAQEVRGTIRSGLNAGLRDSSNLVLPDFDKPSAPDSLASTNGRVIQVAAPEPDPSFIEHGVNLRDLRRKQFAPMNWIIEGLLPEGCCLLAGKPKSKKSWLALGVALAAAANRKAFGKLDVTPGGVLYLDLESNQRRMKNRVASMIPIDQEWPSNFYIFTKWRRGPEAIADLDAWMELHPETKIVIVDVLQKIRAPRQKNSNPYDEDYEAIQPLNEFAERHRITVIVIHHTRKAKADDVFDEISGSTGLTGGTATMWIIGRVPGQNDDSILHIRGRDVDDEELALHWDEFACEHVIEGPAALYAQTQERQQIINVMAPGKRYTPVDIAAMVGKKVSAVKMLLRRLVESNLVQKAGHGMYEVVPVQSDPPQQFDLIEYELTDGSTTWHVVNPKTNEIVWQGSSREAAEHEAKRRLHNTTVERNKRG